MNEGRRAATLSRPALIAICVLWVVSLLAPAAMPRAETPIAIELVLAVDTSRSVDDLEFSLQMKGIARAFRTPEIIELIGQHSGVAVTLFQWNSEIDPRYVIPWHLLRDPASILSFADKVETAERDPVRGFTAIGRAIEFGLDLIARNDFAGEQLKIDVSGDGRSNTGPLPREIWDQANALGVVINGLPILVDTYYLDRYYRDKVIFGPGAFLEIADDYDDFPRAFLRKLRREINPWVSQDEPPSPVRRAQTGREQQMVEIK